MTRSPKKGNGILSCGDVLSAVFYESKRDKQQTVQDAEAYKRPVQSHAVYYILGFGVGERRDVF